MRRPLARVARPASRRWNVTKTLLQVAVFWTVFLVLIPATIVAVEPVRGPLRGRVSGPAPGGWAWRCSSWLARSA